MGFNYERGVAEMLLGLCHRVASTMSDTYGGWNKEHPTSNWDRFSATAARTRDVVGAGTWHLPPNAAKDYDYANPRTVQSSAEDWLNYPSLTGRTTAVNCET